MAETPPEGARPRLPELGSGAGHPVGIYDVGCNDGYVVMGTSKDMVAFITADILRCWRVAGRRRYADRRQRYSTLRAKPSAAGRSACITNEPISRSTGSAVIGEECAELVP
jgi:hypothetical protein